MASKDILSKWKKISALIADEISNNSDFAQKINDVLGDSSATATPKRTNRRPPAKIDPFVLLEKGEDKLSEALSELNVDELKDVISANGMDTAKLAMKWKDRDRLEKHIIEATKRKSSRGEAFWNAQGTMESNTKKGSETNLIKIKLNKDMGKAVLAHGYQLQPQKQYCICLDDEMETQTSILQAVNTMGLPAINDYHKWLKDNGFNVEMPNPTNAFVSTYYGVKPLWVTDLSQGIVVKDEDDDDYYIVMECSRKNEGFKYTQIVLTMSGCM